MKLKPRINPILTKELLQTEYNELQSFRKIGKKYNASGEGIRVLCQKLGVKTNKLVIYSCDDDFFSREDEATFYVAGFIAADGCVRIRKTSKISSRHDLFIGLAKTDKPFLEFLRCLLKAETPVRDFLMKNSKRNSKWNDTWASQISITSPKLVKDLEKFNVVPRKSLIYTFPEWLTNHPLVNHFMRGYNDGDGSFFTPKPVKGRTVEQVYFSLRGTPKFLEVYRSILEEECAMKERTNDIRMSSGHGVLEYGGNGIVAKIAQYLYKDATLWLPRKHQIIAHLL